MAVSTNNGLVNGPVNNLLMQFFTLGSSKIEVFETYFFDIVIKVCKACFGPYLRVFHPIWVLGPGGGGFPRDWYSFFTVGSSKIEVFEIYFFDIVTT